MTVFLCALQICDKEWHYYVINVEFPAVTLFVDGVTYEPYLVTDDWPIHASKIDTQLTVGACWQGQCVCVCVCLPYISIEKQPFLMLYLKAPGLINCFKAAYIPLMR